MPAWLVVLAVLTLAHAGDALAQQKPLTLSEVYELARERNPMARAALAAVDAVAAQGTSAALPPDPEVQLSAMNLSLPGLSASMPGAMLPGVQAMQMLPLPHKLRLSGDIARQSTAMAASTAAETAWDVHARAAAAFYAICDADAQLDVMRETLEWLRQLEQVATSMYSVGGGSQSDVLRAGVEVARMQADIVRMQAMRAGSVARLNALLDRPADTPIPAVLMPALPAAVPAPDTLTAWAQSRPLLDRGRTAVQQARTRADLARAAIWPDLTIGVQYGQRPSDVGTERMASLMLGFTVPVFAARRQLQERIGADAMTRMADAELAQLGADVDASILELVAELERARTLVVLYRSEVLPQAEANVESAFSSYRVGRVDFMTLLDAQMNINRYRIELHSLLAGYGSMIAELEMTIGRVLPVSRELIVEES